MQPGIHLRLLPYRHSQSRSKKSIMLYYFSLTLFFMWNVFIASTSAAAVSHESTFSDELAILIGENPLFRITSTPAADREQLEYGMRVFLQDKKIIKRVLHKANFVLKRHSLKALEELEKFEKSVPSSPYEFRGWIDRMIATRTKFFSLVDKRVERPSFSMRFYVYGHQVYEHQAKNGPNKSQARENLENSKILLPLLYPKFTVQQLLEKHPILKLDKDELELWN